MKKVGFFLLSFFIGVYFTIGGFSVFVYLVSLTIRLNRRASIIETDAIFIPPYPLTFKIGFYASLIVFLVIGYILIHILIKFQSKYVSGKPILKFVLFIMLVFCGFLLAREGIYVWDTTPPMSKEKAIQIALEENKSASNITSEYSVNIFRSIQWSGNRWIVELSDQKGIHCDHISISRLGTVITGGLCNE